jgi:hypothetical protein
MPGRNRWPGSPLVLASLVVAVAALIVAFVTWRRRPAPA